MTDAALDILPAVLVAGTISMGLDSYRVFVSGRAVQLTFQEFGLLRLLISQLNRVVPYESLTAALWSGAPGPQSRRLGVVVCRLRRKLQGSAPYRIETVRGRGYGLVIPVARSR